MEKLEPVPTNNLKQLSGKQKTAREAMKQRIRNHKATSKKKAEKSNEEEKKAAPAQVAANAATNPSFKRRRIRISGRVDEVESDDDWLGELMSWFDFWLSQ